MTPTAKYILTADDKTKSAISSALGGLKSLEKSANSTAHVLRSAFTVFAGVSVIHAFKRVLDETAQRSTGFSKALDDVKDAASSLLAARSGLPEATKRLQELRDVLKDPGTRDAADYITSTLVKGFANAASLMAKMIAGFREMTKGSDVGNVRNQQDAIDIIGAQIEGKQADLVRLKRIQRQSGFPPEMEAQLARIRAEIAELAARQQALFDYRPTVGPSGRAHGRPAAAAEPDKEREKYLKELRDRFASFNELRVLQAQYMGAIEADDGSVKIDAEGAAARIEQDMKRITDTIKEDTSQWSVYAEEAARNMQDSLAQYLFDPFSAGLDGMLKGFIDTIRRMAAEVASQAILKQLFGWLGGMGGFLGSIGTTFGKALTGKASGGPVFGGSAYVVGERGPELFMPSQSGSIVPNHKLGGAVVNIHNNYDMRGSTPDMMRALPSILAASERRTVSMARAAIADDLKRGAFGRA